MKEVESGRLVVKLKDATLRDVFTPVQNLIAPENCLKMCPQGKSPSEIGNTTSAVSPLYRAVHRNNQGKDRQNKGDRCEEASYAYAALLYSLIEKGKEDMKKPEGFQKMHLRAASHGLKPVVMIGQRGLTDELIQTANQVLQRHELIKVKLVGLKDKE